MFGLALWFCRSQNGRSRGAPPHQVLPVLSLSSGFSIVGPCCSHSGPAGSHWPPEAPFSSWLDGRAASPPSESCTQRCFVNGPLWEEATLQTVFLVTEPQNIKPLAEGLLFFFPTMLYHFRPFLHYTLRKNATGIIPGLAIELG